MARMKILLTQDVPNLGQAGDIQTVASGFARNFLIPRGEAIPASPGALKQAEEIRATAMRKRAQERTHAESQAEVISQQRLLFQVRAGENDRLYGSVTSGDITEKLEELVGFEVDRRRVVLDAALRELGIHQVTVRLMHEVTATFPVAIVREQETWSDAERREATVAKAAAEEAAIEAAAAQDEENAETGEQATEPAA